MSTQNSENEQALDRVIGEIRDEPVDPAVIEAAAGRVWSNVSGARGPRLVEDVTKSAKMTLVQTNEADAAKSSPASGHTYLFLSVSTVVLRGESSVGTGAR